MSLVHAHQKTVSKQYILDYLDLFLGTDRPSKITKQKIDEVLNVIQDKPQSSIRAVPTTCSIPSTTAYRITTEYLGLKLFKMQFVEEDLQDRIDTCRTLIPMLQNKSTHENIIFLTKLLFIHMD